MLGVGLRKAEVGSVTCEVLDLEGLLRIIGKGDKERLVPPIPETVSAIRAWLEVRQEHIRRVVGELPVHGQGPVPVGIPVRCRGHPTGMP